MSTSRHNRQTARDELGRYVNIGPEDSGAPRPSPLQTSEPPTHSPKGDITSTFLHHDTPFPSPASPFQFLPQDPDDVTKEERSEDHPSHSGSDIRATPPSGTTPANPNDILLQLIQALTLVGRNAVSTPPTTPPATTHTRIRAPDAFDGSNPEDLRPFLLQCQLAFHSHPQHYATDSSKVFFAISYLKKSALEWFENGVMETNPARAPRWRSNWIDFTSEIRTHFGPANPVGSAEIELRHLIMNYDSKISEYLVRFNTLASRVAWGDAALRFQFYDGLPERLKDKVSMLGKPDSLRELVKVAVRYDVLYWERQAERKLTRRYDSKSTTLRSDSPRTSTTPSTNVNRNTTFPRQSEPP